MKRLTTIKVPGNHARKILFDSDGNINIGGWSPNIYVYDPDSYNLIKTITHKGAHYIDGFVINCDGSRVIADQLGGQVIFANRDGKILKTIIKGQHGIKGPADVAIAPDKDRTLWVADVQGRKVYLF